jgi:hypothetical protein
MQDSTTVQPFTAAKARPSGGGGQVGVDGGGTVGGGLARCDQAGRDELGEQLRGGRPVERDEVRRRGERRVVGVEEVDGGGSAAEVGGDAHEGGAGRLRDRREQRVEVVYVGGWPSGSEADARPTPGRGPRVAERA